MRCPPAEGLIATAVYYLHQRERKLGEEFFQYFELPDGQGYHIRSQLVLQWPLVHTQRLVLEMGRDWRYHAARIELEAEGHLTLARYQMHEEQLRGRVEAAGRRTTEPLVGWPEGTVLDSPAALFVFGICQVLAPKNQREIECVKLTPPSLEPQRFAASWEYLQERTQEFDIGTFPARQYLLKSKDDTTLSCWVDELGVPLQIERTEHDNPIQFKLVRYRQFRC